MSDQKTILLERIVVGALSLAFFVGIWHGFPSVNTVADEMYFVGGVLRAMESHTLLPVIGDVPYGTITYFINYVLFVPFLSVLFILSGFNLLKVKLLLLADPWIMYGFARCISAVFGVGLLWFLNNFLKTIVFDTFDRLALLTLLFSTQIVAFIFHTGKVWAVSTVILVVSFVFLYKAIVSFYADSLSDAKRFSGYAILSAFLAFANFPIMGFGLLVVPILGWAFRGNKLLLNALIRYACWGAGLFVFITFLNAGGVLQQVHSIFFSYLNVENGGAGLISITQSLVLNAKKIVLLFPLLLVVLLLHIRTTIQNQPLFSLSAIYLLGYIAVISVVARWSADIHSYYRYLIPVAFFVVLLISSLRIVHRKALYFTAGISALILCSLLYRLSIPDIYQQTRGWIVKNINKSEVVIVNKVGEDFELPKNIRSYEITRPEFCATRCKAEYAYGINADFLPLIIGPQTINGFMSTITKKLPIYILSGNKLADQVEAQELVSFINNNTDTNFYTSDNIGNYFDEAVYRLARFGKNVYVYKATTY